MLKVKKIWSPQIKDHDFPKTINGYADAKSEFILDLALEKPCLGRYSHHQSR